MQFKLTLYYWILFITSLLSGVIALKAWQKRDTPGGLSFCYMMLAVMGWAFVASMEAAFVPLATKIFWSKFEYVGSGATSVFFLNFAFEYTGNNHWLTKKNRCFLWIFPILTMLLAFTNEWHGLIWTNFTPSTLVENQYIYEHGLGFAFVLFVTYIYILAGSILLFMSAVRASMLEKQHSLILILAALIPLTFSIVYLLDLSPLPGLNLTPTSLVITGILVAWSMLKYRFLDLVPVARDILVKKMWGGMIVVDKSDRVVDINQAAESFMELSKQNVIGMPISSLLQDQPDLVKYFQSQHDQQQEVRWDDKNKTRFIEIQISHLKDIHNRTIGKLLLWHDITQRKQYETEREQLIKELQEANTTKDRFFSIISHDLRNPFNLIVSFANMMKNNIGALSPEEISKMSEELLIRSENTRLLLENLLEWSRSNIGSLRISLADFQLERVINMSIQLNDSMAQMKGIKLTAKIPEDQKVYADEFMTSTILRNLISNSIKFTPRNGFVHIFSEVQDSFCNIQIQDNGIGIEPEIKKKLFSKNDISTHRGTENEKGSGLGLVLCKELVERQGGTISVESTPEKGSTFTFSLPISK